MSQCRTITIQLAKMLKTLDLHIITNVSFNITLCKRYVNVVRLLLIWTNISSWHILNDDRIKITVFTLFQLATQLNSQNPRETEFHNEFCKINFYMAIGISKWRIWSIDTSKMRFLTLFQLDTRLLISKHPKLLSS